MTEVFDVFDEEGEFFFWFFVIVVMLLYEGIKIFLGIKVVWMVVF